MRAPRWAVWAWGRLTDPEPVSVPIPDPIPPPSRPTAWACSFCGKPQKAVHRLIAGPRGVCICDECVDLCQEIIAEESDAAHEAQAQLTWVL